MADIKVYIIHDPPIPIGRLTGIDDGTALRGGVLSLSLRRAGRPCDLLTLPVCWFVDSGEWITLLPAEHVALLARANVAWETSME